MSYKNGGDFMTFLNNHYLSDEAGQALIKAALKDSPAISDVILKQLNIHNDIMKQLQGNPVAPQEPQMSEQSPAQMPSSGMGVALGDEMPLLPQGQSVHIPQNIAPPQVPNVPIKKA